MAVKAGDKIGTLKSTADTSVVKDNVEIAIFTAVVNFAVAGRVVFNVTRSEVIVLPEIIIAPLKTLHLLNTVCSIMQFAHHVIRLQRQRKVHVPPFHRPSFTLLV